jgi:hypothetical protein
MASEFEQVQREIEYYSKLLSDNNDEVIDDETMPILFSGTLIALHHYRAIETPPLAVTRGEFLTLIQKMHTKIDKFRKTKNVTEEQNFHIGRYSEELIFFEKSTRELAECGKNQTNKGPGEKASKRKPSKDDATPGPRSREKKRLRFNLFSILQVVMLELIWVS